MKLMFASDLHGSSFYCEKLLGIYQQEHASRLILLGDLLYHGPRNPLPKEYDPKQTFSMLNQFRDQITAVRGNCDSEVDQMVLEFPMMADSAILFIENRTVFLTHGHVFNQENLPPLNAGDIFIQGHTHLPQTISEDGIVFLNPGSVSMPKENNPPSYMIYQDGVFTIYDLDRNPLHQLHL